VLILCSVLLAWQNCTTAASLKPFLHSTMKKFLLPGLLSMSLFFLATFVIAQPPTVTWDEFFPGAGNYESGSYTSNDVKQSPHGGYVLVGSRKVAAANGYSEVMLMRVDEEGNTIIMGGGETHGGLNFEGIPWDQNAYDMIITPDYPQVSYLVTGYRDTTLTSASSPPGLMLMEIRGDGSVLFDSLYRNNNQDYVKGRCIQPAIGGGYIIAGSIRVDGAGTEQIMMINLEKNDAGKYDVVDMPYMKVNQVGTNGYARWIRQFGAGYLLGGTAYNGDNKNDLFIQMVGEDRFEQWTRFYGMQDTDEFADAIISGNHVYMAGSASVPVPGTEYSNDQIYVLKLDAVGDTIWTNTYGGSARHFANKIMMTGDGNLLVAGSRYDQSMHTEIVLLKIDAETGESLWLEPYGTNFTNAGAREAIPTADYGYLLAGRASYTASQDPRVYAMKLNNPSTANLFLAREGLNLDIVTTTPTKDVIDVTADKINLFGICVKIDSLLHPSVGDLEITLEHEGTTVKLVDQPALSGENFIRTALADAAERSLDWGFAPYTGWYVPEEPLFPFLLSDPSGEWTLTVTDHGTGGVKATRVLEGWSLNLLTEAGAGVGIPTQEMLANFGLEPIRPNPVNQEALISFQIPKPGAVNLKIYNQLGQEVASLAHEDLPEGVHSRVWNPGSLAPGTYFIHLEAGGMISVRKAMIVK
jgi:hypothetical protein